MLFGNYKTKRALQKLVTAYNNTVEDRDNYISATTDMPELRDTVLSKYSVELTKMAVYFDILKESYKDFYVIKSNEELWKLDKPLTSEGGVFVAHIDIDPFVSILEQSPARKAASIAADAVAASKAVYWLQNAGQAKVQRDYTSACKATCERLSLKLYSDTHIRMADAVISNANHEPLRLDVVLPSEAIKQIAIKTATNLVIPKEHYEYLQANPEILSQTAAISDSLTTSTTGPR